MRFARDDVRDHIVSHKSDHGPSYRRCKALQRQRRLKINFREIFGVVRFSTFSTLSTQLGSEACIAASDLITATDIVRAPFCARVPSLRETRASIPFDAKHSKRVRSNLDRLG
jgi:hypothetical protein